ncbi:hypothetical protein [Corynebacterium mayonis]|uniref:hypothetical protein n=1 Tax=Corynebacterium mayonis TaxID=3062461 RepID=UPI00314081A8
MPAVPLPPFEVFVRPHFHIGGSVFSVLASARTWRGFADRAVETSGLLRAINDGGFVGSEGDRYRELLHGDFPQHLLVTGQAHAGLADALHAYGLDLGARRTEMDALRSVARVDLTPWWWTR